MREDQRQFLAVAGQFPVRLIAEQVAWVLNCQPHDIPALVAARLLRPLGNPPANGVKFFCTAEILESAKDRAWLARMSNTICQHWQEKNRRKRGDLLPPETASVLVA